MINNSIMKKAILFDLDDTLINTLETKSVEEYNNLCIVLDSL
jgi:phosphoserine phosphatase